MQAEMNNKTIDKTKINETSMWYKTCRDLLSQAGIKINGDRDYDIQVYNDDFFKRVIQEGSLGLGESYMDGWWDSDKLDEFMCRIIKSKADESIKINMKDLFRIFAAKIFNMQSRKRAWIVGKEHYDLGNDLFNKMLDPYMQYSCGYWNNANNLKDAQSDKLKLICEKLKLKKGMTLPDIGCGWGGACCLCLTKLWSKSLWYYYFKRAKRLGN